MFCKYRNVRCRYDTSHSPKKNIYITCVSLFGTRWKKKNSVKERQMRARLKISMTLNTPEFPSGSKKEGRKRKNSAP